ncbi:MAG: hypothetical protein JWN01_1281 [Patescibacteria group bacterium]|nr:hypothetical protein [Patescibacteria group bacterium]
MIAGPIFIIVALIQAFTRAGFNFTHQPISFLSLGNLGWIQISNFLLSGLLVIAFALGIGRVLRSKPGGTWGPWFLGGLGLGLIVAGLFPPDAGFGYPVGTPDGPPAVLTYHSALHGTGFTLSFVFFVLACIVFVRRDAIRKDWGRVAYTAITAVAALTLSMWPGTNGVALRDFAAAVFLWTWITLQSAWLISGLTKDS